MTSRHRDVPPEVPPVAAPSTPTRPTGPLQEVTVRARHDAGGGLTLFSFDVPAILRHSYITPGQYAFFELGSEEGFFVLASREHYEPWEVLVRAGGGVADALLESSIGATLSASPALGGGFPVVRARGENLVIVMTAGSFAAARAVVARRVEEGDAARTTFVLGARSANDIPMRDEIERMRSVGISVELVVSGEVAAGTKQGYVQDALADRWPASPWVFVAGAASMVVAVSEAAMKLGTPSARIVSNV